MDAPEELKPGTKRCPKCGTVNAARSSVCNNNKCGHAFAKKKGIVGGKKDPFSMLRIIRDYVKQCGGIDAARSTRGRRRRASCAQPVPLGRRMGG